eukprot:3870215-Rhodomonas_salina.2
MRHEKGEACLVMMLVFGTRRVGMHVGTRMTRERASERASERERERAHIGVARSSRKGPLERAVRVTEGCRKGLSFECRVSVDGSGQSRCGARVQGAVKTRWSSEHCWFGREVGVCWFSQE